MSYIYAVKKTLCLTKILNVYYILYNIQFQMDTQILTSY
jgi:hypothetical protein